MSLMKTYRTLGHAARRSGALALLLVAGAAKSASAQCDAAYLSHTGGAIKAALARQNIAYFGYAGELRIVNTTNPSAPTLHSSTLLGFAPEKMDVSGNYLYIAAGELGLYVYDVTNPAAPVQVAHRPGTGVNDVAVSGGKAYVVENNELDIYDVTNPASPTYQGTYVPTIFSIMSVESVGNTAYVMTSFGDVEAVDATNPAMPALLDVYSSTLSTIGNDIALRGNTLAVATFDGVEVVNCTNPAALTNAANILSTGNWTVDGLRIALFGGTTMLYFESGAGVTSAYDITTPTAPVLRSTVAIGAQHIATSGSLAYMVSSNVLEVFDFAVPTAPVSAFRRVSEPYFLNDMAVNGNNIFVLDQHVLQVYNVTNPAVPTLTTSIPVSSSAIEMVRNGNLLYCSILGSGGAYALETIDITNPAAPTITSTAAWTDYYVKMANVGSMVYGVSGDRDLHIIDIANPAAPVLVGTLVDGGGEEGLAIRGERVWAGDYSDGVRLIDISNPASPTVVRTFAPRAGASLEGFTLDGDIIYIAQTDERVDILDVSDPLNPVLLDFFTAPESIRNIFKVDSLLVVSMSDGRLSFVDVADPTNAFLVSSIFIGDDIEHLVRRGNTLWAGTDGLVSIRLPDAPRLLVEPTNAFGCPAGTANFVALLSNPLGATYQWQRNGVNVVDGVQGSGATIAGATTANLAITNPRLAQLGNYRCVITNACGVTTTAPATLLPAVTPTILQQPESQAVCPSTLAEFSVAGLATNPVYQWQIEFPAGSGTYTDMMDVAVARYTVTGSQERILRITANAGQSMPNTLDTNYRCVIDTECGAVTTNPARLTLSSPCDINNDGINDLSDFFDLADAIASGTGAGNPSACVDFNQDGSADLSDVFDLAAAVAGASCP